MCPTSVGLLLVVLPPQAVLALTNKQDSSGTPPWGRCARVELWWGSVCRAERPSVGLLYDFLKIDSTRGFTLLFQNVACAASGFGAWGRDGGGGVRARWARHSMRLALF